MAWSIVVVAGVGAAFGLHMALRTYRRAAWMRYPLPLVVAVWTLLPWRVGEDSEHFAPAFIVLLFRGLFEPEGEPAAVANALLLAAAIVLTLHFVVAGIAFAWRKRSSAKLNR